SQLINGGDLQRARTPSEFDVNVTGVWQEGNLGEGVTVCLLDDGLDYSNPDLTDAYNAKGSYDFNENDYDPMPSTSSAANHHGTRCAGEVAAKANNFYCGLGVAPGARVSMLKILDGTVIDSMEAMAYNYQHHGNYIYSSSWGPPDSGNFIDGPHVLGRQALRKGVRDGRHGYGSIFVVASGNGGYYADNCNFDGYATSEFTVTIGAVTQQGVMPPYAEECACMHGVTVSSGGGRWIVTTDWRQLGGTGCTSSHGGTSAAAPLAAGMIALMLSARPCLSWRDVQHILVLTAEKVDKQIGHYTRNGAGLFHSHKHGFGMLTAWRMVQAAKTWKSVPPAEYTKSESLLEFSKLPPNQTVYLYYDNSASASDSSPAILEHVKVYVNIQHPARGQLIISLYSPSGTHSVLATVRPFDKATTGLSWTFATIRCWGETPYGEWKLAVNNTSNQPGLIQNWRLTLVTTSISPKDYAKRIRRVRDIVTGKVAAPLQAQSCPKSAPLFTADGSSEGAPFGATPVGKLVGWLHRLPLIF
uniref:P/Homo B domain-containing protein n=2 Tax=Macrostomum lignano TaxID=282301 RepID=A0A1I8ILW8_9PLAT